MRYFVILLIVVGLVAPLLSEAAAFPGLGGAFGGRILTMVPCTCSVPPALWITVGLPRPASLIFIPGVSALYKNYSIFSGRWALGTSSGTSICATGFPPFCFPVGTGSIIRKVGTSLF